MRLLTEKVTSPKFTLRISSIF